MKRSTLVIGALTGIALIAAVMLGILLLAPMVSKLSSLTA